MRDTIKDYVGQAKVAYIVFGVAVLALLFTGMSYFTTQSDISDMRGKLTALHDEVNEISYQADEAQAKREIEQGEASLEQTGFNTDYINIDRKAASDFFEPAFTWENGDEYDEIRDGYIEALGEDNTFTKTYLQENPKVKVSEDHTANYIDKFELKMEFGDIDVIPLAAKGKDGSTISYVAFVTFYPYKNSKLVDKDVMESSHAMIYFVAIGEDDDREVTDVEAWGGSSEGLEF